MRYLAFVSQIRPAGMQAWRLGRCLGSRARQRPARYARIVLVSTLLGFVAYHSLRSGSEKEQEEAVGGSLRLRVRLGGERQVRTAASTQLVQVT